MPTGDSRPDLDKIEVHNGLRPRYKAERLNRAQRKVAEAVLRELRCMDRDGATDEAMAEAAGVPVEVIREWRYR